MVETPAPPSATPSPTLGALQGLKLWQALLVYPVILSTLGAGIHTAWQEVKAWRLGVRSSQLQLVQEQERLWRANLDCLTHQGIWEVDGPDGLVVRVSLCKTGDILVRYHDNDWAPQLKWIARPPRKGPDDASVDTPPAPPARRLRGSP